MDDKTIELIELGLLSAGVIAAVVWLSTDGKSIYDDARKDIDKTKQDIIDIFDPPTSQTKFSEIGYMVSRDQKRLVDTYKKGEEIKSGVDGYCSVTSDCANSGFATPRKYNYGVNNLVCCENGKCQRKLKDWAGIYWCPSEPIADRIGHAMSYSEKQQKKKEFLKGAIKATESMLK